MKRAAVLLVLACVACADGTGADPQGHGQNPATLLGALLRLDVDGGTPYAVPRDNPYVGQARRRGEIWATGLRDPWRFSWDRADGTPYLADVGENRWEEVNAVPAGAPASTTGGAPPKGRTASAPRAGATARG